MKTDFDCDRLFSSAYILYKMDECALRDYVWRLFGLLNEIGEVSNYPVPFDFDPMHYLLLNPDVVYAGINPCRHYFEYGQLEGRQYKSEL